MHVLVQCPNEVLVWSTQDVFASMSSMTTYYRNNGHLKNLFQFTFGTKPKQSVEPKGCLNQF